MNKAQLNEKMREVSGGVVSAYQEYLADISQSVRSRERNYEAGYHSFVPTRSTNSIVIALIKLKARILRASTGYNDPTFLDAGCGVGNIMLLAEKVGYCSYGIEYNPKLARIARRLSGGDVYVGDITTYTEYNKYDVIFYYVPISDKVKMDAFCDTLAHQMKKGAYVIPTGYRGPFFNCKVFKNVPDKRHKSWEPMLQKVGKYVTPKRRESGRLKWGY